MCWFKILAHIVEITSGILEILEVIAHVVKSHKDMGNS